VLAAGTFAQASFSAIGVGLPAIAPEIRAHFGLSLPQVGIVLSALWAGTLVTMLPWGLIADRTGERVALAVGLGTCGVLIAGGGLASTFWQLVLLLWLAGAAGAATNSSSGRAVMQWFGPSERGLALGIRQTAIPIGGLTAAIVLPLLGGVRLPLFFLASFCLAGALAGFLFVREPRAEATAAAADEIPWSLRDRRLWLLCGGSGLYVVPQLAVVGFVVLFLHDERGWSAGAAAVVLASVQLAAGVARIAVGRWSDIVGARLPPLRRVGIASFAALAAVTALLGGPIALLVPLFVLAGAVSMSWNGLAFHAAAEFAGLRRSGAAIGFQQTTLAVLGVGVPVAFAATVSATSWRAAYGLAALFPLVGAALLRPLRG
jgi:sugar phosphate permease